MRAWSQRQRGKGARSTLTRNAAINGGSSTKKRPARFLGQPFDEVAALRERRRLLANETCSRFTAKRISRSSKFLKQGRPETSGPALVMEAAHTLRTVERYLVVNGVEHVLGKHLRCLYVGIPGASAAVRLTSRVR